MRTDKISKEFNRIKSLGYVKNNRPNNRDGGIGNTFEDYLGVDENNLRDPDFMGFEVKSKRLLSSAYITLFSKSPSIPKGANAYLKDNFGEVRDSSFPDLKKLYASIFGHREGLVYDKYFMTLKTDKVNGTLNLVIKDLQNNILSDECAWFRDDLVRASKKMNNLFIVFAETKKINGIQHFHYNQAKVYLGFNFDKFLQAIEEGNIQFDLRMGVHKSGKNYGKPHDHGSGFRIRKEKLHTIFNDYLEL